jgi:transcriptional regulator with XRE-family HTH domain
MTDLSNMKWSSMSDAALMGHIGAFVRHLRLQQNRTQDDLARDAGISRSTLSLLERGETVTVVTLIQVLRVLDKLEVMETFTVKQSVSPLAVAKAQLGKRKRASGKRTDAKNQSGW